MTTQIRKEVNEMKKNRKPTAAGRQSCRQTFVSSARASVDFLIQQINDAYPNSITTARLMLTRSRDRGDEMLSPSEPDSKAVGKVPEASDDGRARSLSPIMTHS